MSERYYPPYPPDLYYDVDSGDRRHWIVRGILISILIILICIAFWLAHSGTRCSTVELASAEVKCISPTEALVKCLTGGKIFIYNLITASRVESITCRIGETLHIKLGRGIGIETRNRIYGCS